MLRSFSSLIGLRPLTSVVGLAVAAGAALSSGVGSVYAAQINTGGESGAYHARFCPLLRDALRDNRMDYTCATSAGSRDNIQRIIGKPREIGFAQFDIFALERTMLGKELFTPLRFDGARECLFMVTRNPELRNLGDVAGRASRLRFVLPPEKSGSAATFEFLRRIDPDGLGLAREVIHARSTDAAIERALGAEDVVTLFVQFPDPANPRFTKIDRDGGRLLPVLDRNLLRQSVDGEKLYYAQETDVENPRWNRASEKLVTACTPLVIFTGNPERVEDAEARRDHEDLVRTVTALEDANLTPGSSGSTWARIWRRTKELTGQSVEKMLDLADEARERAGPMMERAREASERALERGSEIAGDAIDQSKDFYDKARERAGELSREARERAERFSDEARDRANRFGDETRRRYDEFQNDRRQDDLRRDNRRDPVGEEF
ncbi:MAG: hypothetical protein AAFQ42_02835 [Pseudomonadota bacterium]